MADTIEFNGKALPLSPRTSLLEAARWIAASIPPTDVRHSVFTASSWPSEEKLHAAKLVLYEDLMSGRIVARGFRNTEANRQDDTPWHLRPTRQPQVIEKEKWIFDAINWDVSRLGFDVQAWGKLYKGGWLHIEIDTASLMRAYPAPSTVQSISAQPSTPIARPTRENALHVELAELFEEWGHPSSNKECWKRLRAIDWSERDSVIQEVVHDKSHDEGCHILWRSTAGIEQRMQRSTFNNFLSATRKKSRLMSRRHEVALAVK